jgi:integrase
MARNERSDASVKHWASCVRVYRFLHRMLRWAEPMSLVGRNVAALIEPPHQAPSKARALTGEEAASVLALAEDPRDQAYFLLALTTGCRRAELAGASVGCRRPRERFSDREASVR